MQSNQKNQNSKEPITKIVPTEQPNVDSSIAIVSNQSRNQDVNRENSTVKKKAPNQANQGSISGQGYESISGSHSDLSATQSKTNVNEIQNANQNRALQSNPVTGNSNSSTSRIYQNNQMTQFRPIQLFQQESHQRPNQNPNQSRFRLDTLIQNYMQRRQANQGNDNQNWSLRQQFPVFSNQSQAFHQNQNILSGQNISSNQSMYLSPIQNHFHQFDFNPPQSPNASFHGNYSQQKITPPKPLFNLEATPFQPRFSNQQFMNFQSPYASIQTPSKNLHQSDSGQNPQLSSIQGSLRQQPYTENNDQSIIQNPQNDQQMQQQNLITISSVSNHQDPSLQEIQMQQQSIQVQQQPIQQLDQFLANAQNEIEKQKNDSNSNISLTKFAPPLNQNPQWIQYQQCQQVNQKLKEKIEAFNEKFNKHVVECIICTHDREQVSKNNQGKTDWIGCPKCTYISCEVCFEQFKTTTCEYYAFYDESKENWPCPQCKEFLKNYDLDELKAFAQSKIEDLDKKAASSLLEKSTAGLHTEQESNKNLNLNQDENQNIQTNLQNQTDENMQTEKSSSSKNADQQMQIVQEQANNTEASSEDDDDEESSSSGNKNLLNKSESSSSGNTNVLQRNKIDNNVDQQQEQILNDIQISPNPNQQNNPNLISQIDQDIQQNTSGITWREIESIFLKHDIITENIANEYAAQKLFRWLHPSNRISILYKKLCQISLYGSFPEYLNNHFVGYIVKHTKWGLAQDNKAWVKAQHKTNQKRDTKNLNLAPEEKVVLFQPNENYNIYKEIQFRSALHEFFKQGNKENLFLTCILLAEQELEQLQNRKRTPKKQVFFKDYQSNENDLMEQISFYKFLQKLNKRYILIYQGLDPKIFSTEAYDKCTNQNILETSLAKLHDVFIEALRQIRLQTENSQYYSPLEVQNDLCQKITELWNSINHFLSIPRFEQCLAEVRQQQNQIVSPQNLRNQGVNNVRERNIYQVENDGTYFCDEANQDQVFKLTNNIQKNNQRFSEIVDQITQDQNQNLAFHQENKRGVSEKIQDRSQIFGNNSILSQGRTGSVGQKNQNNYSNRNQPWNTGLFSRNQFNIKNELNIQNDNQIIQSQVNNFQDEQMNKNKQRIQNSKKDEICKLLNSYKITQSNINQIQMLNQNNNQIQEDLRNNSNNQNQLPARFQPNASQQRVLSQKWKNEIRNQVNDHNLNQHRQSIQSYTKYQQIIEKNQLQKQQIAEDLLQYQQSNQIIQNPLQQQSQNTRTLYIPTMKLNEFNQFLRSSPNLANQQQISNDRLRNKKALHQVFYKHQEKVQNQPANSHIYRLSRKALKQSYYTASNSDENVLISYAYNDGRGIGNITTYTHLLQIHLKANGYGSQLGIANYFKNSFHQKHYVRSLFGKTDSEINQPNQRTISINQQYSEDFYNILQEFGLEASNIGFKLTQPWEPNSSELNEKQASIFNIKGLTKIQKEIRECTPQNLGDPQLSNSERETGLLHQYLSEQHISNRTAIYQFGDNRRPLHFSADSNNMSILSNVFKEAPLYHYIPETQINDDQYAGLNLNLQDDFPVLHLRISIPDQATGIVKYDILNSMLVDELNLVPVNVNVPNVTTQQIRYQLTHYQQQHRQTLENLNQGNPPQIQAPVIEQYQPNFYHDFVNAEISEFEKGQIRQNLTVAVKDEDQMPEFASCITGQNNFPSKFLSHTDQVQKKMFLGFNLDDDIEMWDANAIMNYIGKNQFQLHPNLKDREAKTKQSMDALNKEKSKLKDLLRPPQQQPVQRQSAIQRQSQSQSNQKRQRRSCKNRRVTIKDLTQSRGVSQAQSVGSPQTGTHNLDIEMEDQDKQIFYTDSSEGQITNQQQLIQKQNLRTLQKITAVRYQENLLKIKTPEQQFDQAHKLFEQTNRQLVSSETTLTENVQSQNSDAAEQEQFTALEGFNITYTEQDKKNLYQTQTFRRFINSIPQNLQQSPIQQISSTQRQQASAGQQRMIENLILVVKTLIQKKIQTNDVNSFYDDFFSNSLEVIQTISNNGQNQVFTVRRKKAKKNDLEILVEVKQKNGKEFYDVIISNPIRLRIENLNDAVNQSRTSVSPSKNLIQQSSSNSQILPKNNYSHEVKNQQNKLFGNDNNIKQQQSSRSVVKKQTQDKQTIDNTGRGKVYARKEPKPRSSYLQVQNDLSGNKKRSNKQQQKQETKKMYSQSSKRRSNSEAKDQNDDVEMNSQTSEEPQPKKNQSRGKGSNKRGADGRKKK